MSYEYDPIGSDAEIIRRFRIAQEAANVYTDPDEKVRQAPVLLDSLDLFDLKGREFMADAALVFGRKPNYPPNVHKLFPTGFLFMGVLDNYGNLVDDDVPIDAITANFVNPEVVGVLPDEVPGFSRLTFEVPFLAFNSLVAIEAL
jgi:hypothetical protein